VHFSKIHIENILSFENSNFEFQNYNVIVGINNVGKTNLARILQDLSRRDLTNYDLDRNVKFFPQKKSHITLELKLDNFELKLLFQSIFKRSIPSTDFPDTLKTVKVLLNFSDTINDISSPTTIMVIFNNGLWAVSDHSDLLVFDIYGVTNSENFLEKIQYFDLNQILNYLDHTLNINMADNIIEKQEFYSALVENRDISDFFEINNTRYVFRQETTLKFDRNNPQQYISEIYEYSKRKKDSPSAIHFSHLLSSIIRKNFTSIEEIHPSYGQLTSDLFKLKIVNEKAYQILQESFSSIFNGITVRVEQDSENESRKIIISEKDRDFDIDESASGHYAAIHILHTILNKHGGVLLLDEPEVHFHPIKIRQLSQKLMELTKSNNNQIIIISHSPKFVDFRLLDPAYPYSLLNMTKENNTSQVSTISSQIDIKIGPHLFNPDMFFGNCSLLVEGADDEFTIRSISDKFEGVLDRFGVTIIDCCGVNHIYPTIRLHEEYQIPCIALADKEYSDNSDKVVILKDELETELSKTGWSGTKKELKPEIAYYYIQDLLDTKEGFEKLKNTDIWKVFVKVLELSNAKIPEFEKYYNNGNFQITF